jgi:hypothetical protein
MADSHGATSEGRLSQGEGDSPRQASCAALSAILSDECEATQSYGHYLVSQDYNGFTIDTTVRFQGSDESNAIFRPRVVVDRNTYAFAATSAHSGLSNDLDIVWEEKTYQQENR